MALANKKKVFDERYEILSIVGRGSRSVVYHARLLNDPGNEVALKVLIDQRDHIGNSEKLRKEALAMVACRHRYVIRLDDFHSFQGLCYLSMEYAPEADLRKYSSKFSGKIPVEQAERFFLQTLKGLGFIHQNKALHRDIKPDNILVLNEREIRIGDFGVAVLPGEKPSMSELQRGVGTMNYMAPEVLEGSIYDPRSDLYAAAVTFFEMISGRHPFEGVSLANQVNARQDKNLPNLEGCDAPEHRHLRAILQKAMSYNPGDRFSSAEHIIEAIIESKADKKPKKGNSASLRDKRQSKALKKRDSKPHKEPGVKSSSGGKTAEQPKSTDKKQNPDARGGHVPSKKQDKNRRRRQEEIQTEKPKADEKSRTPIQPSATPGRPENEDKNLTKRAYGEGRDKAKAPPVSAERESANERPLERKQPAAQAPGYIPSHSTHEKTIDNKQDRFFAINEPSEQDPETDNRERKVKEALSSELAIKQQKARSGQSRSPMSNFLENLLAHRNRKKLIGLLAVFVLFFLIAPKISSLFYSDPGERAVRSASPAYKSPAVQGDLLPQYQGGDLSFPLLPSGVYTGSISGLIPGQDSPFSIVSYAEEDILIVIAGIEGWRPEVINISHYRTNSEDTSAYQPPLRVRSSGIVLNLTAREIEGELLGFYKNVATGDTGEWNLKPLR